jgi:hypothetical protein
VVIGRSGKPIRKKIRSGYIQVQNGSKHWMAHRLIWEAVHGPIVNGMQVNHINGIKDDNRLANLEVVSPSENSIHAYRIGLQRADGTNNGRAIGKRRKAMAEAA